MPDFDALHEEHSEGREESFEVMDDYGAEWALRKIREIYAERDRLVAICEGVIQEYNEKIAAYDDRAEKDASYLKSLLSAYFTTVPHRETKTQETYVLPSGTLKLKKPGYEYNRNDGLLAQAFPEYVEHKSVFRWGEFKKTLQIEEIAGKRTVICKDTGEVVPSCALEAVDRPAVFVVEVE